MAFIKSLVLVATVALAISQQVEAGNARLHHVCLQMSKELGIEALNTTNPEAFATAKSWIEKNTSPLNPERKLIEAWEAISKDSQCSASSWDYLMLITECKNRSKIDALNQSVKDYAKRCLEPGQVSEKINSVASGIFAANVDFLDSQFIKVRTGNGNSVVDAIERDFAKQGKSPKEAFQGNQAAVAKYLEAKLFKPCRSFVKLNEPLSSQIKLVTLGDNASLYEALAPEAQDSLFRYRYCASLPALKKNMIVNVANEF